MSKLNQRLTILCQRLDEADVHTLIISDPSAIHYYLDIQIDPMERFWLLLVQPDQTIQLIANELFVIPELPDISIVWIKDTDDIVTAFSNLPSPIKSETGLQIGIDNQWSVGQFLPIAATYPQATFVLMSELIDAQRAVKTVEEQEKMRNASAINDRVMARLIAEILPYGVEEVEAVQALEKLYLEEGADGGFSFEPIIAYGANGADPHHVSDHTRPKIGDSIIIDIGCRHDGYCSDMTRTVYYGEPSAEAKQIYEITKEANIKGIAAAQVGQTVAGVDNASREHITNNGYGDYFTHRTGHFIGQEVHEKGDVSATNMHTIEDGNIFSVEPGIYLPKQTAVRIEDLVITHDEGVELLTHFPKKRLVITPKGANDAS